MLVLGSGKMAKAIAYDFVKQKDIEKVVIASRTLKGAKKIVKFLNNKKAHAAQVYVQDYKDVVKLMKGFDCAVSAVPYNFNYNLARAAIEAGCNFLDLGGNNDVVKQEFSLSKKAKKRKIAIVPDCGLAPGLVSNLTALGLKEFKKVETIKLRVGGLPQHPEPPLNYMIVFSTHGLINEYIESAKLIKNFKIITRPGMEDLEKIYFPGYGNLEAFNTSGGTSTLPQSFKGKIKNLNYKTIRYPGHAEKIKTLMQLGLTSSKKINAEGIDVAPRTVLEALLNKNLKAKDKDLILLKVSLEDKKKIVTYELIDKEKQGLTAMMRCTGFPVAVIAEMIARKQIEKKGTLKHEFDIPPEILIAELRKRGLNIKRKVRYK